MSVRRAAFGLFATVVGLLVLVAACQPTPTPTPTPPTSTPTLAPPTTSPATSTPVPPTATPTLVPLAPAPTATATATSIPGTRVTVSLKAVGDSGQSGEAVLTSMGDKTEVVISIKAGAAGVAQPAHIHDKDCTTAGAVKYPLTSVTDGKSTTVVNATLATLQATPFAVRVHKSGPEAAIYVSCGEIPMKVTVALKAVGDSGQSGEAVLTSMGDKTEVVISIKAGAAGVAQPAHIHDKDCTTAGAVKHPLTSVMDGKSSTVVNATLATLQASPFAVRVHKSGPEAATYVACGEISGTTQSTSSPSMTEPTATTTTGGGTGGSY